MNKALADYLAELESRRYSHSRLVHVRRTIELLMRYLKEAHQLDDWRAVNESHLRAFAVFAATGHRTTKGNLVSPDTLRQWLSCLRCFFAWMNETGRLVHNTAERLELPRKARTLLHVLSETQIGQLIEESPSLRPVAERLVIETYPDARRTAAMEDGPFRDAFPAGLPFLPNEVFDNEFLPDPYGDEALLGAEWWRAR